MTVSHSSTDSGVTWNTVCEAKHEYKFSSSNKVTTYRLDESGNQLHAEWKANFNNFWTFCETKIKEQFFR